MASLYNLTAEFMQIAEQLEEMDLDQETITDTLESLQIPIENKAENIIKFAKNLEAMAEARKNEAKRLTEQAGKDLKKAERLKAYLDETMQMLGKRKMDAGIFQLSYRKGTEVVEIDMDKIPNCYERPDFYTMKTEFSIGKPKLKEILKAGEEIPGVKLIRKQDSLVVK
jgi:chromatin segregation and condensation protein Rec8/ScpA/Scc1 (kleisin family)